MFKHIITTGLLQAAGLSKHYTHKGSKGEISGTQSPQNLVYCVKIYPQPVQASPLTDSAQEKAGPKDKQEFFCFCKGDKEFLKMCFYAQV